MSDPLSADRRFRSLELERHSRDHTEFERVAGGGERAIPDLSRIQWNGRKVVILFDVNVASNPMVSAARRGLASELKGRGAVILLADLPAGDGINGIDGYISLKGPRQALELIQQARTPVAPG